VFPEIAVPEVIWTRPWLGLTLPVFCYIIWQYQSSLKAQNQAFREWFDPHLFEFLSQSVRKVQGPWTSVLLYFGAICLSVFMAGPAIKSDSNASFVENRAVVFVLDIGTDSLATDLAPSRLHHARYKIEDLVAISPSYEYGLVVVGDNAYTISPLSPDTSTLVSQLPALHPSILPRQPELLASTALDKGVNTAIDLLANGGYENGVIIIISYNPSESLLQDISPSVLNYAIGLWQFGTTEGGPIKLLDETLAKDKDGRIIISRAPQLSTLPKDLLLVAHTSTDEDTQHIMRLIERQKTQISHSNESYNQQWTPIDSYFLFPIVIIVVIVLYRPQAFVYQIWYLPVLVLISLSALLSNVNVAIANESDSRAKTEDAANTSSSATLSIPKFTIPMAWRPNMFMDEDHQSMVHLNRGDYALAYQHANSTSLKSIALLALQKFEDAKRLLQRDTQTSDLANEQFNRVDMYHLGLAHFALGEYEEALVAFEQAMQGEDALNEAEENYLALKQFLEKEQDNGNQDQQGKNGDKASNANNQNNTEQQQQAMGNRQATDQERQDMLAKGDEQRQRAADTGGRGSESSGESVDDDTKSSNFFDDLLISKDKTHGDIDEQDIEQTELFGRLQGRPTLDREGIKAVVRKVPDDPSFLLRQRLRLIEQRRQNDYVE